MKNYYQLFLIILFFLSPYFLISQNYTSTVQHYTIEEGLSHREVHSIFQDTDGFMWVGTRFGLNRFDGNDFKWWTTEDHHYNFNNISRIGQDDAGWLWLWNENEILFLHPQTEEIKNLAERFPNGVPFETKLRKLGSWKYWQFREMPVDKEGKLYFAATNPTRIITFSDKEGFKETPLSEDFQDFQIKRLTKSNIIWGSSGSTLLEISITGKLLNKYPQDAEGVISQVHVNNNQVLYHISNAQQNKSTAYLLNTATNIQSLHFVNQYIDHFNTLGENIWIRTDTSWEVYNLEGQLIHTLLEKDYGVDFHTINFSYRDRAGKNWFGSDFGLTCITINPSRFNKHFSFSNKEKRPYNNSARGIALHNNKLLVNFEMGGLTALELDNKEDWQLLHRTDLSNPATKSDGIYDYWSRPILEAADNQFWMGGKHYLELYNATDQTLKKYDYQIKEGQVKPVDIWSLFVDSQQTVWVGTGNGLAFKEATKEQLTLLNPQAEKWAFSEAIVLNFIQEDSEHVWLCTNQGLYLFNLPNQQIEARYWSKGQDAFQLPIDDIKYLYKDAENIYWLATGGGLIRWDLQKNTHRLFGRKEGLPNTNLYVIYEDYNQHLWLSSDYGIIQFNKTDFSIQTYLPKDGISYHEFNRISHYQAPTGNIYFGSMNGVTSFHPKDFHLQTTAKKPNLVITEYTYFDVTNSQQLTKTGTLRNTMELEILPNTRFHSIAFALLNYEDPTINRYAYKIDGIHKDWMIQKDNFIRLNGLPYGNYSLHIKGSTTSGLYQESELTIPLRVVKPFYLQSWFLALATVLLLLLVYAFAKWRNWQLEKQKQHLEQEVKKAVEQIKKDKALIETQAAELAALNATKDRLFAIISHDLRRPALAFRGIAKKVNYLIQEKDFTTLNKLGKHLDRAAFSLNGLLDNLLNWALKQRDVLAYDPKPINVQQATRTIYELYAQIADDKGVDLQIEIQETARIFSDPNAFTTIVRNLVDNAIKYTGVGGTVKVSTQQVADNVLLKVSDTGIGIKEEFINQIFDLQQNKSTQGTAGEVGSGLGLTLVRDLVELNKGTINIISKWNEGTTFEVLLPAV